MRILRIIIVLILVEMVVTVVYPLLWMVLGGFKTTTELLTSPFSLPAKWKFSNYTHIWKSGIQTYFLNSLFITICSSALVAVISAFAAFALSRYRFKCRYFVFIYLIGGMMLNLRIYGFQNSVYNVSNVVVFFYIAKGYGRSSYD